jgi:hypothetical protein
LEVAHPAPIGGKSVDFGLILAKPLTSKRKSAATTMGALREGAG